MTSQTDLAALLCSRLCHDLLSPVGALSNGIELLADETDPEMQKRCVELLEQSAKTSTDKLKFFRLAFGAAGGFGEAVDTREALAAMAALEQAAASEARLLHEAAQLRVRRGALAEGGGTFADESRTSTVPPAEPHVVGMLLQVAPP